MKKRVSKLLSLLLSIVMLLSITAGMELSASASSTPKLDIQVSASKTTAKYGDIIDYTVYLTSSCSKLASVGLGILLPHGLTYVDNSVQHYLTGMMASTNYLAKSEEVRLSAAGGDNITLTAKTKALSFRCKVTTEYNSTQSLGLNMSYSDASYIDNSNNTASLTISNFDADNVNVQGKTFVKPTVDVKVSASKTTASYGDIITYTVYYTASNGILGSTDVGIILPEGLSYIDDSVRCHLSDFTCITNYSADDSEVILAAMRATDKSISPNTKIMSFQCKVDTPYSGIQTPVFDYEHASYAYSDEYNEVATMNTGTVTIDPITVQGEEPPITLTGIRFIPYQEKTVNENDITIVDGDELQLLVNPFSSGDRLIYCFSDGSSDTLVYDSFVDGHNYFRFDNGTKTDQVYYWTGSALKDADSDAPHFTLTVYSEGFESDVEFTVIKNIHEHDYRFYYEVEATCSQVGRYYYICDECGSTYYLDLSTDPNNHNWNGGVVTREPTAYSTGIKTYTCYWCGKTRTETIPKLKNGWVTEGGNKYYYNNGTMYKYRKQIDGKYYYFNGAGVLQKGWIKGGTWMYGDLSTGALKTAWFKVGGKWYWFKSDGSMVTGWQKIGGTWYLFNASGAMLTGWQKSGGSWYYFTSSGAMVTGWQKIGGTWYYFNGGGDMVTGWKYIGGSWYYFNSSGSMRTANLTQGGKTYRFYSSGACINP